MVTLDSTTSVFDRLEGNIEEDINVDGQFLGYSIHSRGEHIIVSALTKKSNLAGTFERSSFQMTILKKYAGNISTVW